MDNNEIYKEILSYLLAIYGFVISTDPEFGVAITVTTALTSMAAKYLDEEAEKLLRLYKPDELAQIIMNLTSAFNEEAQAATKKMQEVAYEAEIAQKWWQKIQESVNQDGSIKETESIEELKKLIDYLNDYISENTNIKIHDNKIQDYTYFSDNMEDIISITRIENQKEILAETRYKAYGNINWIKEQLEVTGKNLNDEANNYNNYLNLLEAAKDAHSYTKDDFTKREIAIEEAKENVAQLSALYYALRELEKAYQAPIDKYDSLLDEEKKYEIEPLEKEKSTPPQYDTPDMADDFHTELEDAVTNIAYFLAMVQDADFNAKVAATINSNSVDATPAAAYVSPTENSSSESQSGCCCKIDVDRILEGLNKPISITLNEEVVGEAVLTYANNKSHMTGN